MMNSYHLIMFLTLAMLISLTHSLECTKQNFTNKSLYEKCVNLPYLSASLHWTYDQPKSSLSIVFVAPLSNYSSWIAWAINPTGTTMVGSQSLIAFQLPNGTMTAQTYNITSYGPIKKSKILYDVTGMKAEHVGGVMKLYATLALPEKLTEVNQVWQVGGTVVEGVPMKHDFAPANLQAMGALDLTKGTMKSGNSSGPAISPAPAKSTSPDKETKSAPPPSGVSKIRGNGFGLALMLLVASLL